MTDEKETKHAFARSRSNAGLGVELERQLRAAINPLYENTIGTESYERKRLIGEIDLLRDAMHEALEAGEDGDWQSARRALCLALTPNV